MKKKIHQIALLSLTLMVTGQLSQAAVATEPVLTKSKTVATQVQHDQPSLIAKAAEKKHLLNESSTDSLQLMTSMQAAPAQNFLASQNQKFTRFIQSIFS